MSDFPEHLVERAAAAVYADAFTDQHTDTTSLSRQYCRDAVLAAFKAIDLPALLSVARQVEGLKAERDAALGKKTAAIVEKDALKAVLDQARDDAERLNEDAQRWREKALAARDEAARLREALDEAVKDLVVYQVNARTAAGYDSRWDGVAEHVQPTIDRARAAKGVRALQEQEGGA